MGSLPCEGCRGLCCGPVPVTQLELNRIKKKIKSMPAKKRSELENQTRYFGTCIFYDLDRDRCGIHADRPEVCRLFGYHQEMPCFRKPEMATSKTKVSIEKHVGTLSIDYKWDYFK